MIRFSKFLFGVSLAVMMSFDANAYYVDALTTTAIPLTGLSNNNPAVTNSVNQYLLANDLLDPKGNYVSLKYKQDVGNPEVGPYASLFSTSFNSNLSGATITYDRIDTISPTAPMFLLVKDGNQAPYAYLFDISSWNRTEDIVLSNFWSASPANPQGQGEISYIAIYTTPDGGTTLMLLGMALLGFGAARRFLRASLT
jgi:hypothetical protein